MGALGRQRLLWGGGEAGRTSLKAVMHKLSSIIFVLLILFVVVVVALLIYANDSGATTPPVSFYFAAVGPTR